MKKESIYELFKKFENNNPNPKTELNFTNEYTLLVAVVLSAQATDKGVNKATKELFKRISTPLEMVNLGEENLKKYIQSIGLFNTKAKNIITLSNIIIKNYNACIPQEREELQKLPGVGRKTANVVLNVLFNKPFIPVDTHIFRVSKRLGLSNGKNPLAVEYDLEKIIPEPYKIKAHHWLILHGRYICRAKKPLCDQCFASSICPKLLD